MHGLVLFTCNCVQVFLWLVSKPRTSPRTRSEGCGLKTTLVARPNLEGRLVLNDYNLSYCFTGKGLYPGLLPLGIQPFGLDFSCSLSPRLQDKVWEEAWG